MDSPLGVFEEQVLVALLRVRDEAYGMGVRREIERVARRAGRNAASRPTADISA